MQFTTAFLSVIALFVTRTVAAPSPTLDFNQTSNSTLTPRFAWAKLNQYHMPDCLNEWGTNKPAIHNSPWMMHCYNIHYSTVSFYYGIGSLHNYIVFDEEDCKGRELQLSIHGGCQEVETGFEDDPFIIKSIMGS